MIIKDIYKKILNLIIVCNVFVAGFLPVSVLADTRSVESTRAETTFYSYDYFGLNSSGTVLGINLNVSRITPVVFSISYNGSVIYAMAFILYAGGYSTSTEARAAAPNLLGIPKTSSGSLNWTYGTMFNGSINTGSYIGSLGQTVYYYYSYIIVVNSSNFNITNSYANWQGVYTYSVTDMLTYTGGSSVAGSNGGFGTFANNYVKLKLSSETFNNYYISSVPARTWLKADSTITPAINVEDLSQGDGSASSDGSSSDGSSGDGGSGSGSGGNSQTQSQTIAEGAIAFTIEDGAFTQSQTQTIEEGAVTQSQSIEENAVNVTVNNQSGLTYDEYDDLVNSSVPPSFDLSLSQGINVIRSFSSLAVEFSNLCSAFFGFLPSWCLSLFSVSAALVVLMIVLRLIHLFM